MVRRFIQVLLLIPAAFAFLLGIFPLVQGDKTLDHTFENNHKIESLFAAAHQKIDDWQAEHGRLPTSQQFDAWTETQPEVVYGMQSMMLARDPTFFADIPAEYASIPADGYLLLYWRGEWMEYSPSWTKKSSIEFDRSKYFMYGSARRDGLFWVAISFVLASGAYVARPRAA